MRKKNITAIAIFSFIIGCMLTLSLTNFEKCQNHTDQVRIQKQKVDSYLSSINYVTLIFSKPTNKNQRQVIRDTWLQLIKRADTHLQSAFKHYFVIGISTLKDDLRFELLRENAIYEDLLILPQLEDHYSTLSKKLMQSLKWLKENIPNLLYVIKCDDDSFVRADNIVRELHDRTNQLLISSKTSVKFSSLNGKLQKLEKVYDTGYYWGYFKGNAHIRTNGNWAETDWFLCDRYLPYALGGGYVLSIDIVAFITDNYHYLKLYNSEDVSLGVWTAPLSRLDRHHDIRFDTEWSTRGCNNTHLIRHKQSIQDLQELYKNLLESGYQTLCKKEYEVRKPYEYKWNVRPSHCCS